MEKAIHENDYHICLLLLDMSKAFDTVNRRVLFEHLEEILNKDEMPILGIITNKPELIVKIGSQKGDRFVTNTGIMQGDCLRAILFIFYLAKCLENPIKTNMKGFLVNQTYAYDLTIAGTSKMQVNELEQKTSVQLKKYNLKVTAEKAEKYEIPRAPPPPPTMEELIKHNNDKVLWSELDWLINYEPENTEPGSRKCKLLRLMLDTRIDINRRKVLTVDSMKSFQDIYKSKRISTQIKVRTFNAYSASVFLYNSYC